MHACIHARTCMGAHAVNVVIGSAVSRLCFFEVSSCRNDEKRLSVSVRRLPLAAWAYDL